MSATDNINRVKNIVAEVPLKDILDIADSVAGIIPIPGLPQVIKVLNLLYKLQRPAEKVLGVSSTISSSIEGKSQKDEIIEQMIEIACEDGVIDDEEEAFLRDKAVQLGMDPDFLMFKVRAKLKK